MKLGFVYLDEDGQFRICRIARGSLQMAENPLPVDEEAKKVKLTEHMIMLVTIDDLGGDGIKVHLDAFAKLGVYSVPEALHRDNMTEAEVEEFDDLPAWKWMNRMADKDDFTPLVRCVLDAAQKHEIEFEL